MGLGEKSIAILKNESDNKVAQSGKGDLRMKKIIINGKEITTNLGGNYPISDGNNTATMSVRIKDSINETDEAFVERLASYGYTKITLKYATTRVRGYYNTYALVK
jgi:hypothetical protein